MKSEYSALAFGFYICIKLKKRPNNFNFNIHTISPSGIYSSTQLAICGITSIPTPAEVKFAGSTQQQKRFHRSKATAFSRCQKYSGNFVGLARPVHASIPVQVNVGFNFQLL